MDITDVRVKRVGMKGERGERLHAFCSFTIDGEFVVSDVRVIEGAQGLFIAMPSRRVTDHCPRCRGKNHLRAKHCNDCGARLADDRVPKDADGRVKLFVDVAHPINTECREKIQKAILAACKEAQNPAQPQRPGREGADGEFGREIFS